MTKTTKTYKLVAGLLLIVSILLNVAPLGAYTIIGLSEANLVSEKVALVSTVFVVLILSVIAWINKTTMRSRIWVVILGLYFCLDSFIAPLLIIAITQVLDEWIISPLHKYYKNKYSINREIDKRGI